jgi:hypothetical protein
MMQVKRHDEMELVYDVLFYICGFLLNFGISLILSWINLLRELNC